MSMYDDCEDYLPRAVTACTIPCLDEINEITYSENNNEYDPDLGSSGTSNLLNSRQYGSKISKKLTYDILKRYTQLDPLFVFDNKDDVTEKNISQKSAKDHLKEKRSDNSSTTSYVGRRKCKGVQYEVASETEVRSYHYSRSNSVCNVEVPRRFNSGETHANINNTSLYNMKEKKQAEKMTYCRPVTNSFNNEELFYKTVERNRRLQKLVKKMTVAREHEKQENAWNNYINELRHKHGYHDTTRKIAMPFITPENTTPELIEDFYRTNFKCQQSNHCKHLLQDFYEPCTTTTRTNYYKHLNSDLNIFGNMNFPMNRTESYTISPDPRLSLKTDRSNQCESLCVNCSHHKAENGYDKTIFTQEYSDARDDLQRTSKSTVVYKRKPPRFFTTSSIQTNLKLLPFKKQKSVENVPNNYNKVAENILKIKNFVDVRQVQTQNSFESIERKLDNLINSVNTLITEVRKPASRNSSLDNNKIMSISRSVDAVEMPNMAFHGRLGHSASKLPLVYNLPKLPSSEGSVIDNIIVEEMNKSDEVKRDIENILNGDIQKSCAVQIINDFIPTRERSTEVSISLSENKVNCAEQIHRNFSQDHRMTIAVNTDPLGLQALLRISKETVKNVLSYMQNFSYLNLLQLPLLRENGATTPFVCSVCGAMFMTTSQLTEHIHSHVSNRYCCVCRHLTGGVTANSQNPRRLFFCEFCTKPFSRAYCCELHQQTCAKRLGRLRDVTSSLVLLR